MAKSAGGEVVEEVVVLTRTDAKGMTRPGNVISNTTVGRIHINACNHRNTFCFPHHVLFWHSFFQFPTWLFNHYFNA